MLTTQELKAKVKIENIINQDFTLRDQGRFLRAKEHDSLIVDTRRQLYFWNSRGESGDVYTWLMARHNWDFRQAKAEVARLAGIAEIEVIYHPVEADYQSKYEVTPDEWPEQGWQDGLIRVMMDCQKWLFEPVGSKAKGWLNGPDRHLSDETLQRYWLGYNPESQRLHGHWVYAGIIIPHYSKRLNTIFGLKIRLSIKGKRDWERHHTDKDTGEVEPAPKYCGVSGNKMNLFGVDTLEYGEDDGFWFTSTGKFKEHVFICEGEFDVMILSQFARDLAGAVTLGGAKYRLPIRWLPAIAHTKRFHIALDADDAGYFGAGYWLSLTAKKGSQTVLPPGIKDITELVKAGYDLHQWVINEMKY
ncbi:MAG: toprim domain-containing protein [Anaerolineae bacterium]|nr:toprim domain-containing protein [Anaerolineae bacterium]